MRYKKAQALNQDSGGVFDIGPHFPSPVAVNVPGIPIMAGPYTNPILKHVRLVSKVRCTTAALVGHRGPGQSHTPRIPSMAAIGWFIDEARCGEILDKIIGPW